MNARSRAPMMPEAGALSAQRGENAGLPARRIVIAAVVAQVVAIVALIGVLPVVIMSDPLSYGMAEASARRLANWVMPAAGFVTCFVGGWWAVRKLEAGHARAGCYVGIGAAVLDVVFLAALGAPLRWLFVVSELGRVAGGMLGGKLAALRAASRAARAVHAHTASAGQA